MKKTINPKDIDSNMIMHVCEPEKHTMIPAGFYKEYISSFQCKHCGKTRTSTFKNLTVQANLTIQKK